MQAIVDEISGMQGIADIKSSQRVPRGFYDAVDRFLAAYDAYAAIVRDQMDLTDKPRAGEGEGTVACHEMPMGVTPLEALAIYRKIRTWRDFPEVAERMSKQGEELFTDIQSGHKGGNPEQIRMTSRAVREGRAKYAARGHACPFLDEGKGRCRIWDVRPVVCRGHHITGPIELANPKHERHQESKATNVRVPVRQQLAIGNLDRRMELALSPFLHVGVLQLLQMAEGEMITEVGEAPQKMQQDGRVAQRANRNVKHSAKNQKKKKKDKAKAKKKKKK